MNQEIYAKSAGQLFIWANKTATTTIMLPMKESDFDMTKNGQILAYDWVNDIFEIYRFNNGVKETISITVDKKIYDSIVSKPLRLKMQVIDDIQSFGTKTVSTEIGSYIFSEMYPSKKIFIAEDTDNGYCFKDRDAFDRKDDIMPCFIPEIAFNYYFCKDATKGYTYHNLLKICENNVELLNDMFNELDSISPELWLQQYQDRN